MCCALEPDSTLNSNSVLHSWGDSNWCINGDCKGPDCHLDDPATAINEAENYQASFEKIRAIDSSPLTVGHRWDHEET